MPPGPVRLSAAMHIWQERLREERAKKKVLWEEELQRELEFQKQQRASLR